MYAPYDEETGRRFITISHYQIPLTYAYCPKDTWVGQKVFLDPGHGYSECVPAVVEEMHSDAEGLLFAGFRIEEAN